MNKKNIKIEGKRINLIPLREKDATAKYASWINDPEINKFLDTKKATIEGLKEYIKGMYNDPNALFLGVFLKDSNIHIGNVKIEPIDFNKKMTSLGTLIGDKNYWGKGYASEAYRILIKYAFNELKLEFIEAGIPLDHIAALKAVQKVGFKIKRKREKGYVVKLIKKDFKYF